MPEAGEYTDRFEWLKRVAGGGGKDEYKQPIDTFPSQGFLWGVLEDQTTGRKGSKESEREQLTATIRIRNYPAVVAGDVLDLNGTKWTVEGFTEGDNEISCDVTAATWTVGGGLV